jgi:hypothetical protein
MLSDLIRRCEAVQEACGGAPGGQGASLEEEGLDDFTKLKKSVARQLKDLREKIKERDDEAAKHPHSKLVIELSQETRTGLQHAKDTAKLMSDLQRKTQKKKVHIIHSKNIHAHLASILLVYPFKKSPRYTLIFVEFYVSFPSLYDVFV